MQTFAARGLAEGDEAKVRQTVTHFLCGVDDDVEGDVWRWIEIEH